MPDAFRHRNGGDDHTEKPRASPPPYSSTLNSKPRMLEIRQSIVACALCPKSDNRNGRK